MEKIFSKFANTLIDNLSKKEQEFIKEKNLIYHFSFQELKQIIDMAVDLKMWQESSLAELWEDKKDKKSSIAIFVQKYQKIKNKLKSYENFEIDKQKTRKIKFAHLDKKVGFGRCPVASEKTRCCNLMTLDVVESCGFDCSYCSISSFYNEDIVSFIPNLREKLDSLRIEQEKIYHIGTGQSSDSLMWGNKNGILEALFLFAKKNPNVILELKSKSDNIEYFLKHEVPKNIIVTWSLNPQVIIEKEERLTSSLSQRLKAAKKIQQKGLLIGFHFHPMIYYQNWKQDYKEIFEYLLDNFDPKLIAMISFGTLTFIKPVIKKLRKRAIKSKILQMPLVDASGKLSYPYDIKKEMFIFAYTSFKKWHNKVYFYFCMEDKKLWKDVFGFEYSTNEEFEEDMKSHYLAKIKSLQF